MLPFPPAVPRPHSKCSTDGNVLGRQKVSGPACGGEAVIPREFSPRLLWDPQGGDRPRIVVVAGGT